MSKKSRRRHFELQYIADNDLDNIVVDDFESPEISIDAKDLNWQDFSNPRNGFCFQRSTKYSLSEFWRNSRFTDRQESDDWDWDIQYLQ